MELFFVIFQVFQNFQSLREYYKKDFFCLGGVQRKSYVLTLSFAPGNFLCVFFCGLPIFFQNQLL